MTGRGGALLPALERLTPSSCPGTLSLQSRGAMSQDLITERRGPEQAAMVAVVLIGFPCQEFRRSGVGRVVPAICAPHRGIHLVVQVAQALHVGDVRSGAVEVIISIG